ncbi:shikimate kinase [Paenibacillus rigui]|uniref:Shikimate kinase n=1 Tax=Paenibacillus rigui TaxID=554312 RepID=A0A229USN4_9BACL|nr:shikimate kinase [Paenibacillus rigui]OXM85909.1 shikimate kinase [Paenibacillus rigui]
MSKSNIVLVGFMGTGKSTVGKELSNRLGWTFTDTDTLIEVQQGMPISEIFRLHGEAAFRKAESDVIETVLKGERQIISTGGGAVLAEQNRTNMLQGGFVVALSASAETIIQRVSQDQTRPLVQGNVEERVKTLLQTRKHAYDFAELIIDTTQHPVSAIAELIMEHMKK